MKCDFEKEPDTLKWESTLKASDSHFLFPIVLEKSVKSERLDYLSKIALTPGNSLPSRYSSIAPPPVDT
jgi:hypothetical protein